MSNDISFGEYLRQKRVEKGVSLRGLAPQLSITPSYLSDIENDRRIPAEEVIQRIAEVLELENDDLMAMAGRFGEQTERYLKNQPTAVKLFRRISEFNLDDDRLRSLIEYVEDEAKRQ